LRETNQVKSAFLAAVLLATTPVWADEPVRLIEDQMDRVTAGDQVIIIAIFPASRLPGYKPGEIPHDPFETPEKAKDLAVRSEEGAPALKG
jgi:hypothetical protein